MLASTGPESLKQTFLSHRLLFTPYGMQMFSNIHFPAPSGGKHD